MLGGGDSSLGGRAHCSADLANRGKMAASIVLNVDDLTTDIPALTRSFAGLMQEAIAMCMREHNHLPGVSCDLRDFATVLARAEVVWTNEFTDRIAKAFGSTANAAELAGEGMAILTIIAMTDYTIVERSIKGSGVDFWLGHIEDTTEKTIQRAARMEVKGRTRIESDGRIHSAVRAGMKQTTRSAATKLPVCVVLTEFSRPIIYMVWT